MTNPLTPTAINEQLDEHGWLDAANGPAVYALELAFRPDPASRWRQAFDTPPLDGFVDALRVADTLVYVGSSHDAAGRLRDHATGERHQASLLAGYPPTAVYGVWAVEAHEIDHTDGDNPVEFNKAGDLAGGSVVAWTNGTWF